MISSFNLVQYFILKHILMCAKNYVNVGASDTNKEREGTHMLRLSSTQDVHESISNVHIPLTHLKEFPHYSERDTFFHAAPETEGKGKKLKNLSLYIFFPKSPVVWKWARLKAC